MTTFRDVRFQQVIQPGGRGSFFERALQVSAQPIDKLQNHARFCLDDAFHHDLSCTIPHRNRNAYILRCHGRPTFGRELKRMGTLLGTFGSHQTPL